MNSEWTTRLIAIVSATVALSSLIWTVTSWRLAGPSLRFHCLWYRSGLEIRVFNAGRVADYVEQVEIGGLRRSPLTRLMGLPAKVEPGQSLRWFVGIDHVDAERQPALRGGWCSLWVLTGSMRQRRAEILPLPEDQPSQSGWRLVPRRAKLPRLMPALSGTLSVVLCTAGSGQIGAVCAGLGVLALAAWMITRLLGLTPAPQFGRRKAERRFAVAVLAFGLVAYATIYDQPMGSTSPVLTFTAAAMFLAGVFLSAPRASEVWHEWPSVLRQGVTTLIGQTKSTLRRLVPRS